MASLLSAIAPLVIRLRGSKRMFSSADRTLRRVERERRHPTSFEPPASLTKTVDVSRETVDGWPIFVVSSRGATDSGEVVYLHGGCYVFEINAVHWKFIAKLANEAGVRVIVPIMPLAPVATASEVVPRIARLLDERVRECGASRVSVVGDSSGGGMALAAALARAASATVPLRSVVLISPWLDISGTDPRLAQIAPRDPWLAIEGTHAAGALYRGELSEEHPFVSPIHGDLSRLGPVLMFSGTRDILNADAQRLVSGAASAGFELDYHEGEGMIHNYPILPMPEGDVARAQIVRAVRA